MFSSESKGEKPYEQTADFRLHHGWHFCDTLVSMGFAPGTPLSTAKRLTQADLKAHHVPTTVKVLYRLSPTAFIPGYPTLTYYDPTIGQLHGIERYAYSKCVACPHD